MSKVCMMHAAVLSGIACAVVALCVLPEPASAQIIVLTPRDPGVRGGAAGAGDHLPGLTTDQITFFEVGQEDFAEAEGVGDGLGPRFNLDGCGGCHAQP